MRPCRSPAGAWPTQASACAAAAAVGLLFVSAGAAMADEVLVVSQQDAVLNRLVDEGHVIRLTLDKAPAAIAVDADGGRAVISHPDLGKITLVDLAANGVLQSLDVGGQPFGVDFAPDGHVLAADWSGNALLRIDLATETSERLAVGTAPSAVVVDRDRNLAYTVDRESDRVSRIDLQDFAVTATAAVGRAPFAAALSADGRLLYVANVQSGDLSVVGTEEMREIRRVPIGGMPYGVAVAATSGRVLVTDQEGGRLVFLDADAVSVTRTVRVGEYPEGVAVLDDGGRALVANWFSDTVTDIDLATFESRSIDVAAGPRMLAVLPSPRKGE